MVKNICESLSDWYTFITSLRLVRSTFFIPRIAKAIAAVLYVLAREYENTDDTLRSMAEYVEDRLLELYPEKAYRGMMSKMADITISRLQKVNQLTQNRINSIDGVTFSSPNESYFNLVSDSAIVEFMQMTDAEALQLIELAIQSLWMSLTLPLNSSAFKMFITSAWTFSEYVLSSLTTSSFFSAFV